MKRKSSQKKGRSESLWIDELTMEEIKECIRAAKPVIWPVGSVEEHGSHLPLCTDTLQPEYVAEQVAKGIGCVLAPSLRYGVCNSTRNFPGTISIEFDTLRMIARDVLKELIRNGFTKILVLSGHAGSSHMEALRLAARDVLMHAQSATKSRCRIMVCSDYDFAYELRGKYFDEKDGHAGTIETSRIMVIRPDLVRGKGQKSFPKFPRFEVITDAESYFPTGVIGDPTDASAAKGKVINSYIIEHVSGLIKRLESSEQ